MKQLCSFQGFSLAIITTALLSGCGKVTTPVGTTSDSTSQNGIVHGKNIKGSDELGKSVVALVGKKGQGQVLCTGTIIAPDTVLTAAHCVSEDIEKLTLVFAPRIKGVRSENLREATSAMANPLWMKSEDPGEGDIALVHFAGGLPEGYAPVQLASPNLELKNGTEVTMIGYGVTNGLEHKGAGLLRQTQSTIVGEKSPSEFVTDGHKSSVCFGDSGGPAFALENGQQVQWGVAHSVSSQACDDVAIHTSVMAYRAWISKATTELRKTVGPQKLKGQKRKSGKSQEPSDDNED